MCVSELYVFVSVECVWIKKTGIELVDAGVDILYYIYNIYIYM